MKTWSWSLAATAAGFGLCLCASAPAQSPLPIFKSLAKGPLPAEEVPTRAVALGDVDGDGDLDAVAGVYEPSPPGARVRLWLNDGEGHFADVTSARMPAVKTPLTTCVALGDIDGDGDLDILEGNTSLSHVNHLFLNDGKGYFKDASSRLPYHHDVTRSLALCDVDFDGDLDIVVGNGDYMHPQVDRLYLNDGKGNFLDATSNIKATCKTATSSVVLGDIDGDGDPDLVEGNSSKNSRIYLNDGKGVFTPAPYTHLPSSAVYVSSVAIGDVDKDGDLDLVMGCFIFGITPGQNKLYLNDGRGRFTDATAARLPAYSGNTNDILLADLDGDGDLDLVEGDRGANRLYLNDGKGFFKAAPLALPGGGGTTWSLAAGDVDGNRTLDLLAGNEGRDHLYLNQGKAVFRDTGAAFWPEPGDVGYATTFQILLGDLDGDGDMDAVYLDNKGPSRVYINLGWGKFRAETRIPVSSWTSYTTCGVLADLDGDGDLDLVAGDSRFPSKLFLNDGKGNFKDATMWRLPTQGSWGTAALAAGDVDGDGDLDLVFGNGGIGGRSPNYVLLNDGKGFFKTALGSLPKTSDPTTSLVLADLDGDGDLDLVAGNYWTQNRIYWNDGKGKFTEGTARGLPQVSERTTAMVAGDVDSDGDLDLVLAERDERNRLYLNDGKGRFSDATASRLPKDRDSSFSVALGDVDGDGDLDLLFGNNPAQFGQANRILLNNGKGVFQDATAWNQAVGRNSSALALGDLDGDGDLDLLLGQAYLFHGRPLPARAVWNMNRHLVLPWPGRPGYHYRVDLYGRPGRGGGAPVAIPLVSPRPGSLRLPPLGLLRLDPGRVFALPPLSIPKDKGRASLILMVPKDPALAGRDLFFQGLVSPGPGAPLTAWRFTNAGKDTWMRF